MISLKPGIFLIGITLFLLTVAGCTDAPTGNAADNDLTSAASLYSSAEYQMNNGNYRTAAGLYEGAYTFYRNSGDICNALSARNGMFRAKRSVIEFPFNRTQAEADMRHKISDITDSEIDDWLSVHAQNVTSDEENLYFGDISINYLYADYELLRGTADKNIDFGYLSRYAIPHDRSTEISDNVLPYRNLVQYRGTERLEIPEDMLPETGVLKIWYPLPLETGSQRNVSVTNLSCEEYIVSGPVTEGQIGYVYYEVPVEEIPGDLVITADIGYTSYEEICNVNPDDVGVYNTKDPEYIQYTTSARNIEITDEIKQKAGEIVGGETNPYIQVQKIYGYIIDTYPYSYVPHLATDTIEPKTAESTYMFNTGHGDCGTQSMFFSAMCRSLGIPARAPGGYQMLLSETPASHFWAEYYIEGYGWIPCDPTVAEIADWLDISDEKRDLFRKYYANNLDPARFVIQQDVDLEMTPPIPDDAVVFRLVRQKPAIVSDTSESDLDFLSGNYFTVDLEAQD